MKRYAYYPGCSLETMGASYHLSAVETATKLDVDLQEVEDWNCCGATPYSHIDELLAKALCARNLAIAEKANLDLVAPCSGCYRNMYFANATLKKDAELAEHMNFALEEDDLHFAGSISVHHLMHVFAHHVGIDAIKQKVTHPLKGLRVAPYYGCHILRPRKQGESVEDVGGPHMFEDLIAAIGAVPIQYSHRLRCCGGSLIATNRKAAIGMVHELLRSADNQQADVIATACPLCQINLEVYQGEVNREYGTRFAVSVMYFTQLMGLALGVDPKSLGIGKEIVPPTKVLACRQH